MRTALFSLTVVACAFLSGGAFAQTLYVVSPPTPGVAPTYTGWRTVTFSAADDGNASLTLPFSFTFYGVNYSTVGLNTNGLILFTPSHCGSCYSNSSLPKSSNPNNLIAYWWDDMKVPTTARAEWTTSGVAPDQVFSLRLQNWESYSGGIARNVQVDLHERSGAIIIYYGPIASGTSGSATVGIEDATGASAITALSCSPSCTASHWPTNQYLAISPAIDPDLTVLDVSGSALNPVDINGQPGFELDVVTTIKNQGQNPATGFLFDVYLSSDAIIDPATDTLIAQHTTPESLAGRSQATFSESGVQFVRPPGTGSFYLGVLVDPTNIVDEAIESNNTGVSAPYISGVDLTGTVSGPASATVGEPFDVEVTLRNRGLDPAGPFDFQVYFSADEVLDSSDVLAHWFVGSLQGLGPGETLVETLHAPGPPVPDGNWRLILLIDPPTPTQPEGRVVEVDETNNLAVSSGPVLVSIPDLIANAVLVRSPVEPFPEISSARFGEEVRVTVDLINGGIASPRSFDLGLYLSDNPVISVYDQALAEVTGLTLTDASLSVDLDVTLPLASPDGALLSDGDYYFGVFVDLHNYVPESNETNNLASSATVALAHGATACAQGLECESGFCVDGFCCDTACGGGDPADCQACSVAEGAAIDGRCGPVATGAVCRASSGVCDVAERCDGASPACPADAMAAAGTTCDDGDFCTFDDVCDGTGGCSGEYACQPDSGMPPDAGEIDAGGEADAGESDAGAVDAGAVEDAGVEPEDASVAPPDGGQPPDAGEPPAVEAEQPGGCGCGASAGGLDSALALLIVAAGGWRRRHRT